MRFRMAFLSLGLMAAAAFAAMPAMAADTPPQQSCQAGDYLVQAVGPTVGPCRAAPTTTCTRIAYSVSSSVSGSPDHLAVFLRAEAGVPTVTPAGVVWNHTDPCTTGDGALGLGGDLLCHDRLIHINNQGVKSGAESFELEVPGKRLPITTTFVVKQGRSSQVACPIVGIGLEDTTATGNCVHQCGAFDPNQSVRTVETFKFKGCEITFEFDPTTGELFTFDAQPIAGSGANCTKKMGLISELFINGGLINPEDPNASMTFGDGWISSGNDSCATRLIAGRYCTVCQ